MRKPFIFLWIAVMGLAVFVILYMPVLTRYRELKMQETDNARKIRVLEEQITSLEEERELLLNDPEYLEKVIRTELGLVRPGEVVYKFVDPNQVDDKIRLENYFDH